MHDWTLSLLSADWATGNVTLHLSGDRQQHVLKAEGVTELRFTRELPWGPSVSVNSYEGPSEIENGLSKLVIDMQTGDRIELTAKRFRLPQTEQ